MKLKRTYILLLYCIFASCGDDGPGGTLRWRAALDVPVNFSWRIGDSLGTLPPGIAVPVDLGTDTVSTDSDAMSIARRLSDPEIAYSADVTNGTGFEMTVYGMLFGARDRLAGMGAAEFLDTVKAGGEGARRVNVFGGQGLRLMPDETKRYDMPERDGAALCSLTVRSNSFYWRWLLIVETGTGKNAEPEPGTEPRNVNGTDSVSVKIRMRFSGVNSFDSLLVKPKH